MDSVRKVSQKTGQEKELEIKDVHTHIVSSNKKQHESK